MNYKRYIYCVVILSLIFKLNITAQKATVTNYTVDDGLPQNNITSLALDHWGYLWVGTNAGLSMYNGHKFFDIKHDNLKSRILHTHYSINDQCINIIDESHSIFRVSDSLNAINQLEYYNNLRVILSNKIKASSNPSLLKFLQTPYLINIESISDEGVPFHFENLIDIIYQANVFLIDNVLIRLDSNYSATVFKKDGSNYRLDSSLPKQIKEEGLLFTTEHGTFWLAHNNMYEIILDKNRLFLKVILTDIPLDLKENGLTAGVYNYKKNHFFISSFSHGLFKITPNYFESIKSEILNNNNNNRHKPVYYNQVAFDNNKILVNNAILIANNETKKISDIDDIGSRSFSFLDKKNNLWYPSNNHIVLSSKHSYRTIDLPNAIIYKSVCEYNDSLIFVSNASSLTSIANYQIKKTYSLQDIGLKEDVNINYILKGDETNTLNILTNTSINIFDLEKETSKKIDTLPLSDYRIMTKLSDGLFFVGTYGKGYYIKKGTDYISMPLDLNEYLRFAHMALCDEYGHVWISTNNGLFRIPLEEINNYIDGTRKDLFYYYYDTSSGLINNEFNGGCQAPAIKLKDGNFSFSNMSGLVQFNPLEVPAIFPIQDLVICNLYTDGRIVDSPPTLLTLNQDVKNIQLEISTPFYGHFDNLVLEYRVSGYSDKWQKINEKGFVVLQNIGHGDHNIEIRKRIGFGAKDYEYLNYPIRISPYFYQTLWFKFLIGIIALGLITGIYKWYERYNIQRNKALEILIKKRTDELSHTNQNLKNQVRQNELFQSIFVHDIKSPIRFITSNSELLRCHWSELDNELKLTNLHHINDASTNIGNFIEETLLWMKIQKGELKIKREEFKVFPLLQKIIDLYKTDPKIINGDIQLLIRCNPELNYLSDNHLLSTILRNLLANSIKYTKKGSIELFAIKSIDGKLSIGCSDTGTGMSPQLIDQLLSKEYQGNDIRKDSFKMGFVIIKDITETLNGLLTISSKVNSCTKIVIEISDVITKHDEKT